ncbi:MAG: bacillithiol biosynthesis deacetylase BshB1 [Terriglobia bacterium]
MKLDALAIGAHPDDIELFVGGTLAKLASLGRKAGVVDLVRGELGSRGTPRLRAREAAASAKVLGLAVRENLKLTDGQILDTPEARLRVVKVLRKYRPDLVFTHFAEDKHPDHVYTSHIVTGACYLSGLAKLNTGQPRFRPGKIFYFQLPMQVQPSFLIDVSGHYAKKMAAIRCFKSQLFDPNSLEPETYLSVPEFLSGHESLDRYYGHLMHAEYAEGFYCREPIGIDDPVEFFRKGRKS